MVRSGEWRGEKKKLIAAAEHWAAGSLGEKASDQDTQVSAALTAFGLAGDEQAQAWLQQINDSTVVEEHFTVFAENAQSVSIFCALQTSWNLVVGLAGCAYVGLNYTELHSVLQLMNIPRKEWPELFNDIRIMERAALPLLNLTH